MQKSTLTLKKKVILINIEKLTRQAKYVTFFINLHKNEESETHLTRKECGILPYSEASSIIAWNIIFLHKIKIQGKFWSAQFSP